MGTFRQAPSSAGLLPSITKNGCGRSVYSINSQSLQKRSGRLWLPRKAALLLEQTNRDLRATAHSSTSFFQHQRPQRGHHEKELHGSALGRSGFQAEQRVTYGQKFMLHRAWLRSEIPNHADRK